MKDERKRRALYIFRFGHGSQGACLMCKMMIVSISNKGEIGKDEKKAKMNF